MKNLRINAQILHIGLLFHFLRGFINRHQLSIKGPEKSLALLAAAEINKLLGKNEQQKAGPVRSWQGNNQGELSINTKTDSPYAGSSGFIHMKNISDKVRLNSALVVLKHCTSHETKSAAELKQYHIIFVSVSKTVISFLSHSHQTPSSSYDNEVVSTLSEFF